MQGSPLRPPSIMGEVSQLPEYGLHVRPDTHAGSPIAGISAQPGKHPRLSCIAESQKKHSPDHGAHSLPPGLHCGMQLLRRTDAYRFTLGRDPEANFASLERFLENDFAP